MSFKRLVNTRLHVFKTQRVVYLRFAEEITSWLSVVTITLRHQVKIGISELFAFSNRSGRPILM